LREGRGGGGGGRGGGGGCNIIIKSYTLWWGVIFRITTVNITYTNISTP